MREHTRRLAILDIDGTLTDTISLHQTAFLSAMESFSFPNLNRNWSDYRHHTDTAIFEEAWFNAHGTKPTLKERGVFHERVEREFEVVRVGTVIREIPGAAGFVRALIDRDWAVVFATGGLRQLSRRKLVAVGIPFAEPILITASEHVTRHDLVSCAMTAAADHYGFRPDLTVSIGDGLWDMETASDLGLPFVGVGNGPKADMLRGRGATVIPDFQNLSVVFDVLAACERPSHES